VAAATGILPKKLKGDLWDFHVRVMLAHVTHDTAGYETTSAGQVMEWLHVYLANVTIHDSREEGLTAGQPWKEEGHVYVTSATFKAWLSIHLQEKIPARTLGLALRTIDAQPVQVVSMVGIAETPRSAWRLPKGIA